MDRATMKEVFGVIQKMRDEAAQLAVDGRLDDLTQERHVGAQVGLDQLKLKLEELEAEYAQAMAEHYNKQK